MRNPERVLNSLVEHSKTSSYRFERLYRILFNDEMFYVAYQRIYAKEGNMTEGSDGQSIDNMSLSRIEKLIASLRDESYQPQPSRRIYIPKKNGKVRPLGIPAFDDKLVQEVIRMILEAIYEESFEYSSHGFRPNRSCHTALAQIKKSFNGAKWFIEGDIKGFFDNIGHDILISILKERISDDRFIRLIRKFLKAGYIEDWKFHKTYSGTPQGGIVSPILANIYLDRLDKYMKEYITNFDKGKKRRPSRVRMDFDNARKRTVRKLKSVEDESERTILIQRIKAEDKQRAMFPSCDEMDTEYKRLKYVRYADDFLIGIIGSKQDAKEVKEDIKNFLDQKLKLELSDEKTLITHTEDSAHFLGYEIFVRKSNAQRRDIAGRLRRTYGKRVYLKLSMETIRNKLLDYGVLEFRYQNGKEIWKPKCRSGLIFNDDLEILDRYNREIRGFYNYFSIANNCSELHNFKFIMEYSMYKTFAGKYKSSTRKINSKYRRNGKFTVRFTTKSGAVKERYFYDLGFRRKNPMTDAGFDIMPYSIFDASRTSLVDRLKAEKCEMCGATEKLVMHHVRKLKNLEGKKSWERHMIARRRKTVAVCHSCHQKIHNGTLD
ncbi:reverse transcriptase domain-containing protein [Myroides odoratimimus]|uniref:reverse transcriptase domain-containing protein n=1 Tax=Myroides odoratimimus TaxID=76832 RepID=UPI00257516FD|nr:reverse transcriptase domain-containing protein [Myroides odoratimimus]MDM1457331.1 group II intron reverse transcriptase/maturase [Myroides odoratimimus]MEC4029041.1 reverse transcriptase domain-containing protein [Myroides odoratimimus]MEC4043302.1 reverse transcriptase domain-containing protein [Myroides odoratimimus]MEC4151193.1 reverse transcriptase domain-containing protein [Myroides odoratimimus]